MGWGLDSNRCRPAMTMATGSSEAVQVYRDVLKALRAASHWRPDKARTLTRLFKTHYRADVAAQHAHRPSGAWRSTLLLLASAAHSPRVSRAEMDAWRAKAQPVLDARAEALVMRGRSHSQLATQRDDQAEQAALLAAAGHEGLQQDARELMARAHRTAGSEALGELGTGGKSAAPLEGKGAELVRRAVELTDRAAHMERAAELRTPHDRARALRLAQARLGTSDPEPSMRDLGLEMYPLPVDPLDAQAKAAPPAVPGATTLADTLLESLSFLTYRYLSETTLMSRRRGGGTDTSQTPAIRAHHWGVMKEDADALGEDAEEWQTFLSDETGVDEKMRQHLPLLVVPPRMYVGPKRDTRGHPSVRGPRPIRGWDGQRMRIPAPLPSRAQLATDQAKVAQASATLYRRQFVMREANHISRARLLISRGTLTTASGDVWDETSGPFEWEMPTLDMSLLGWSKARLEEEQRRLRAYLLTLTPDELQRERGQMEDAYRQVKRAHSRLSSAFQAKSFITAVVEAPKLALAGLVRDAERENDLVLGSERFKRVFQGQTVEP